MKGLIRSRKRTVKEDKQLLVIEQDMYKVNGVLGLEWWTDGRSSLQGRRRADFQLLEDSKKIHR